MQFIMTIKQCLLLIVSTVIIFIVIIVRLFLCECMYSLTFQYVYFIFYIIHHFDFQCTIVLRHSLEGVHIRASLPFGCFTMLLFLLFDFGWKSLNNRWRVHCLITISFVLYEVKMYVHLYLNLFILFRS